MIRDEPMIDEYITCEATDDLHMMIVLQGLQSSFIQSVSVSGHSSDSFVRALLCIDLCTRLHSFSFTFTLPLPGKSGVAVWHASVVALC